MKILQPPGWARPSGFSNGVAAKGEVICVAGMIGWDASGEIEPDFPAQFVQLLDNIVTVLKEADAGPEHIVRMTWYITDMDAYRASLKELGAIYRSRIGRHYPAMAVIGVSELVEPDAMVEIEAMAIRPD